jgi:adenylate cyclase
MFSKYVSEAVVNEMLRRSEIKLGGEKQELTVLFCDIRGFTSMSEKLPPEEVVKILNEFLSAMTDIIFKNRGTLDKFMGDAVMAVFGAPVFFKDHALCAVRTAFMMKGKLNELNEKWKKQGRPMLAVGMGINTGEAIAGNMGSIRRVEYTVIGDTVNLASRLESLNKELNTEILMSEATYSVVKDNIRAKEYKDIKIKGKEKNIKVYEAIEYAQ